MKPTIHFWLAALSVAAITIILIIIFDCGIPCKLPQVQIDQINNVLLSLSTSAICSILFYYILVYYPEKQRAKIIQSSIKYNLDIIVSQMNWLFAVISYTYPHSSEEEPNPLYSNLTLDKHRGLLTLDITEPMPVYGLFNCSQKPIFIKKIKGIEDERIHYTRTIPIDFQKQKSIILENLTIILSLPSISLLDINLINNLNKLSALKMSAFLTPIPAENSDCQTTKHYDLSEIAKYYKIYLALIEHVKPTVTYKLIQLGVNPLDRDIL